MYLWTDVIGLNVGIFKSNYRSTELSHFQVSKFHHYAHMLEKIWKLYVAEEHSMLLVKSPFSLDFKRTAFELSRCLTFLSSPKRAILDCIFLYFVCGWYLYEGCICGFNGELLLVLSITDISLCTNPVYIQHIGWGCGSVEPTCQGQITNE